MEGCCKESIPEPTDPMDCSAEVRAGVGDPNCKQDELGCKEGDPGYPDCIEEPDTGPVDPNTGAGGSCPAAGAAPDTCDPFGNDVQDGEDDVILNGSGEPSTFPVDDEDDDPNDPNDGGSPVDSDDPILPVVWTNASCKLDCQKLKTTMERMECERECDNDYPPDEDDVIDPLEVDDENDVTGDPGDPEIPVEDDDDPPIGDPEWDPDDDPNVPELEPGEDEEVVVDLASCFEDCARTTRFGPDREACERDCGERFDRDDDRENDGEFASCFDKCKAKGYDDPSDELAGCFDDCRYGIDPEPSYAELKPCYDQCDGLFESDQPAHADCLAGCLEGKDPPAFPVEPEPVDPPDPPIGVPVKWDPLDGWDEGDDKESCEAACEEQFELEPDILVRCKEEKCSSKPPSDPFESWDESIPWKESCEAACDEQFGMYPDILARCKEEKCSSKPSEDDPYGVDSIPYKESCEVACDEKFGWDDTAALDLCKVECSSKPSEPKPIPDGTPCNDGAGVIISGECFEITPVVNPADTDPDPGTGPPEPIGPRPKPILLPSTYVDANGEVKPRPEPLGFDHSCGDLGCQENRAEALLGFARVNTHRKSIGLNELKWDERLYRACYDNALYCCQNGRLVHMQPQPGQDNPFLVSSTPYSRAQDAGYVSGYGVTAEGEFNQVVENAGTSHTGSGVGMVEDWINEKPGDDGHKRNIEDDQTSYPVHTVDGAMAVVGCFGVYLGGGGANAGTRSAKRSVGDGDGGLSSKRSRFS